MAPVAVIVAGCSTVPSHGHAVELFVRMRRFRCVARGCPRQTFTEALSPEIARQSGRRPRRLDSLISHLGVALGGRPAAALAQRLMLSLGKHTLLRAICGGSPPGVVATRIIGIDERAWRRRERYGTLICDLERRRAVDLLPDREPATVKAWLAAQSGIHIVARDRAGGYAGAVDEAASQALQVAGRWYLMENASAAFLAVVRSLLGPIRRALGAGAIDPSLLSAAERLQYEGYLRRCEENDAIRAMAGAGAAIKEIARRTGRSRKLVRGVLRNAEDEVFRSRASSLAPWLVTLASFWSDGCRNGAELWRRLRTQGFSGSLRIVGEWATRRRRSEGADGVISGRLPPARSIARAMLISRDRLTRADAMMVTAMETALPALSDARSLAARFHRMVRLGSLATGIHAAALGLPIPGTGRRVRGWRRSYFRTPRHLSVSQDVRRPHRVRPNDAELEAEQDEAVAGAMASTAWNPRPQLVLSAASFGATLRSSEVAMASVVLSPPVTPIPARPPQTFAREDDRARLTPSSLVALRSLAKAWALTGPEAAALLGVSESTWDRIKAGAWRGVLSQDQLMRVSAMIGTFKGLHLLFADDMADRWVRLRNSGPLFNNLSPIEAMIERGIPGMIEIRQHVDALRGGL
jgi:transposase